MAAVYAALAERGITGALPGTDLSAIVHNPGIPPAEIAAGYAALAAGSWGTPLMRETLSVVTVVRWIGSYRQSLNPALAPPKRARLKKGDRRPDEPPPPPGGWTVANPPPPPVGYDSWDQVPGAGQMDLVAGLPDYVSGAYWWVPGS